MLPYLPIGSWSKEILELGEIYHGVLFNLRPLSEEEFSSALSLLTEGAHHLNLQSLHFALARLRFLRAFGIKSVNVGGTMGCGKSSISEFITDRLGFTLRDADHFHTDTAREKMSSGIPLTDADRFPFLRDTQAWLRGHRTITTCSALTDLYRAILCGLDASVALDPSDQRRASPWSIENPNLGVLLIVVKKPYALALEELDRAFHLGPPRMFNGKPHFIQVSKQSEEEARQAGKTPLLESQYNLLNAQPPMPWEAISIDAESIRSENGLYDRIQSIEGLQALPFLDAATS